MRVWAVGFLLKNERSHAFYQMPSQPNPSFDAYPGPEYYGDDIFDWSVGAASLPAPPRRTLQRMGVPEQLRQFFLLKVRSSVRSCTRHCLRCDV